MDTIEPLPTDRPSDRALRSLGPAIRRIRGALGHRGPAPSLVRAILGTVAADDPARAAWAATTVRDGDPAVIAVGPPGSEPSAFLRIARSPSAVAGLDVARRAQTEARAAMGAGAEVVPEIVAAGTTDGARWIAERALAGEPGRRLMTDGTRRARAVAAVARAIRPLHGAATARAIDDDDLRTWVTERVRLVASTTAATRSWADDLERRLDAALRGRMLPVGRIHGDLWLENARFAPGGDRVTALVDWDSSAAAELALQDLVHLAVTTRRRSERRDFGPVLVDLLDRAGSEAAGPITLRSLLSAVPTGEPEDTDLDAPIAAELEPETSLLLAWLRFVQVNVARHPELAADRRWVEANVRRVVAWR